MTDQTKTGGPAFRTLHSDGMTLRDWLAGMAMAGAHNGVVGATAVAARAYRIADAMLKEREK